MRYATETGSVVFESLWRTRYENDVPVVDMESDHILNTIDYLATLQDDPRRADAMLPFIDLPRTAHNIEVLKRELLRRAE